MNTPTSAPTVIVLGANGRFGAAVSLAFANAGWSVLAQTRRPLVPALAGHANIVPLKADYNDTAALVAAGRGAAVVVHGLNPLYTQWLKLAQPMADAAMDLAQALGATLMVPGNVYNFGTDMPLDLTEGLAQRAATRKGQVRIAMEQALRQRSSQGLRCVVLRAGDFFGAGRGTWFDLAMVKAVRKGHIDYPGPLDAPHAWAYLPDLARTFVAVAERHDQLQAFEDIHVPGHTLTGAQMVEAIAQAAQTLGWATPAKGWKISGMPWGLFRLLSPLVPILRELVEMQYLWRVPHRLLGNRLQALGIELTATPLHQAVVTTLAEMGPDLGMPVSASADPIAAGT